MRVHHLNTATLCPRGAALVTGTGGLFARARLVCHALLVEGPDGLVLVDTGLGTADVAAPARLGRRWVRQVAPRLELGETAAAQVEALGYARGDVRHIVLTHLDLDHAGGIADFPAATVHVHAREHAAALAAAGPRGGVRYVQAHWSHGPRWRLYDGARGEPWLGFAGAEPLAIGPGGRADGDVVLVPLHGHTAGHCGVAVRAGDRWLLHAGDGYFFHGQLAARPHAPLVLRWFQRRGDTSRAERVANQARLRELALTRADVELFCSHDAVELDRARGPSPADRCL